MKVQPTTTLRRALGASALILALTACAADDGATTPDVTPDPEAAAEQTMPDGGPSDAELAPVEPSENADTHTDRPAATDPTAMTEPTEDPAPAPETDLPSEEIATLGAGCFWCIEAVLEQIDGVKSVVSGYMGGHVENPTYREVCSETTGHAEVVQVTFDPSVISYQEVLDWFWRLHDPTTLNRQGADRGTQYRSAIFYHSDEQRQIAETSKKDVQPSFDDPIVTEVTAASTFYVAEEYHQGYYFDNQNAGYCRGVIKPKLKKLGLKY